MDPEKRVFRFVLFFNCLMTFGSYFCMEMTSVLQNEMQGTVNCSKVNHTVRPLSNSSNLTCCQDCLYITPDQFNLLYSAKAWTIATIVPFIGLFIDKVGDKLSAILMSAFTVIGYGLFAFGSTDIVRYTDYMLPVLFIGRLLPGVSAASVRVVQARMTAFWFKDKELSAAYGITTTVSRLGSVLNFFISPNIAHKFGLTWALSFGVLLCLLGFVSTVITTNLDSYGIKKSGRHEEIQQAKKDIKCKDITTFCAEFWLIIATIMFFYSSFVPFVANCSKYIHDMYDIDERKAAYMVGAIFDISILMSPILGYVVDRYGGRFLFLMLVGVAVVPAYILLDFTLIHPLIITAVLRILLCWYCSKLSIPHKQIVGVWPCMFFVIESKNTGLALGLNIAFQGIGVGVTNAIVGQILGDYNSIREAEVHRRWRLFLIPLCINMLLSSLTGTAAVLLDRKRGRKLMKPKETKDKSDEENSSLPVKTDSESENDETKPLIQ